MRPRGKPTFKAWSGIAYRATSYDVPLWVHPNRREGRWNLAYDDSTQYMSLDAEAPFAELLRHERIDDEGVAATFRTTIWQVRIEEGSLVDYGTFERADAAGFPPEALVDDDHERCHAEAKRLRGLGAGGILSPSAALPGSVTLTLFGPRVAIPWDAEIGLASAVPAQRIGVASPPPGLVERVRQYGSAHAGLDAYRARTVHRGC